jgi:uncharacterized HAD superfamily protein
VIFRSIKDLSRDIREKLLPALPRDIGIVYGIPRSGMIPATIIATALGAKLGVLGCPTFIGARQRNFALPMGDKTLVVDDSVHHGRAIAGARAELDCLGAGYYTCAVYAHSRSTHLVDFFADVLDDQRIFEWNFSGIKFAGTFCWSLDRVICMLAPRLTGGLVDGIEDLRSARPLYLPQIRVRAIIAERAERWRTDTEAWLAKYGVVYDELIMLPNYTEVRQSLISVARYKVQCLKETGCEVLVEGQDNIAKMIAGFTGLQVLSVESMRLYPLADDPTVGRG